MSMSRAALHTINALATMDLITTIYIESKRTIKDGYGTVKITAAFYGDPQENLPIEVDMVYIWLIVHVEELTW